MEPTPGTRVTFKLEDFASFKKPPQSQSAKEVEEKASVFKIASAEDSDSIFEDHLQEDKLKKLRAVEDDYDSDEYGGQLGENDYSLDEGEYSGE
jgi:hypothetical protein